MLAASDAHLAATVVHKDTYDPFPGKAAWVAQTEVASMLLQGCIVRRELVSVLMDGVSTPEGVAVDDEVRRVVNRRLRATTIVCAACLDSRSNDGLQLADVVAGAIAHERRRLSGEAGRAGAHGNSPKAKVARRLAQAFDLDGFEDQRSHRINIATMRGPNSRAAPRVNIPRRRASPLEVARLSTDTGGSVV